MLKRAGYAVTWAGDLPTAARAMERSPFDLVVAHGPFLGHPISERVRSLAEEHGLPMLTLDGSESDDPEARRRALAGRVEALLAARAPEPYDVALLIVGDLSLDLARHAAVVGGRPLVLTSLEFDLLRHLARRPGWVWSRQQLLEQVWGYEVGDLRVVTVHIGNLRRKLGRARPGRTYVETVRGVGYRLADLEPEPLAASSREGLLAGVGTRPPSPRIRVGHPPFVGREAELSALTGALAATVMGQVRVVGLAGEAGIGKTRLAEEFSGRAAEAGLGVWWGSCHQGRVRPSYEPWMDVLEAWERESGRRYVEQVFRRAAADKVPSHRQGGQERLQLFHELAEVVRIRAAENGICLVFEDLHWADAPSLLALQYVVRHLRDVALLALLTYRPFERSPESGPGRLLTDVIAEVARSDEGFVLSLAPLSRDEVGRFVELFGPDPSVCPASDLSAEAYEQTEGNPFFLTQLMRLLRVRSGGPEAGMPRLGRDEGVRSVILQRMSGLSGPCRRWLESGSVCGREFGAAIAAEAAGLDPAALPEVVAEAGGARLITLGDDAPEQCRFGHSLIQEVLRDGLAPEARARLHAELATILERRSQGDERSAHFRPT